MKTKISKTMKGLLAVVVGLAPVIGHAASNGATTADFLTLEKSARAAAMGGTYTATVDNADAIYQNVGALTRTAKRSVTLMHAAHLDTSYYDFLAYSHNLGRSGAFGGGIQYFSAGDIVRTDITGAEMGKFRPRDFAVS